LEIYAPLARRIGVNRVCVELEDLSFFKLNPAALPVDHPSICACVKRAPAVSSVSATLSALSDAKIECRVFGREKRPYSIWRKLERKHVSFDDIADIYAFRILVRDPAECYAALGVPFIRHGAAFPSASGTIFRCPSRTITARFTPRSSAREITRGTADPHRGDGADRRDGVAAHWRYKSGQLRL
jgi:guanosine-3',5'-bis(diphosphate) 3'-pyrophosphohydrolase